jgi:threonine dehydrogenase-like Zn-dependent dehydrogenase
MTSPRVVLFIRWAPVRRSVTGYDASPVSYATTARCCWTWLGSPKAGERSIFGCGLSGILDLLAERVGPAGRVVGLEVEPANVALAREFAAEPAWRTPM